MLSRKQLLGGATVKTGVVEISGGEIGIRAFNGAERVEFLEKATGELTDVESDYQAQIVCKCAIDEEGEPVFRADDVESIFTAIDGESLQKIVLAILDLSGLTADSAEELEKNSQSELSVVPGSDSQRQSAAQ